MDQEYVEKLKAGHDDGVPRDMTMAELRVGDHVMIPCRVSKILGGGKFQNIEVVTDGYHFPWKPKTYHDNPAQNSDAKTRPSVNSRQCIKDVDGDHVARLSKELADANRAVLHYEAEIKRLREPNPRTPLPTKG